MQKPAFLFDLDGTLADTLPDLAVSTNHVRKLHGLAAVDLATVRTYIGDGARTLLRRALNDVVASQSSTGQSSTGQPSTGQPSTGQPSTGHEEQLLDQAFANYVEHHREHCTVHSKLFPGVREHLTELQNLGHPIAIVTNKPEQFARPVAQFLGLDQFTTVIVGGDTLPTKKPDPAMLRHALERLGCPAGAAIASSTMVGDGRQDLRAGKALGLRTVACLFGYGNPDELRAEGANIYWGAFAKPE